MLLEELLKTERNEGRLEGRLEGMAVGRLKGKLEVVLENLGSLPSELAARIENEADTNILESWLKAAKEAESIEAFIEGMQQ